MERSIRLVKQRAKATFDQLDIFTINENEVFADIGAFDKDTLKVLLKKPQLILSI